MQAHELIEGANEGDELTVNYDSAHSDDVQEISGEVLEAGRSWNGEMVEAEFKNSDGIYCIRMDPETGTGRLERNSYSWQNGERVKKTGSRRVTQWGNGDAINHVGVVDNSAAYTCWECGAEFDREADHNHHVMVSH